MTMIIPAWLTEISKLNPKSSLNKSDICKLIGVSCSCFERRLRTGKFPKPDFIKSNNDKYGRGLLINRKTKRLWYATTVINFMKSRKDGAL